MQKGSALPILLMLVFIAAVSTASIYFFHNLNKQATSSGNEPKIEAQVQVTEEEPAQVEPKQESFIQVLASENQIQKFNSSQLKFEFEYQDSLAVLEETEKGFDERENGEFRKNFKNYIGYEPAKFLGAVNVLDAGKSFETNPLTVWVFENTENVSAEVWYKNYWYYPFVWGDFTQRRNDVAPTQAMTIAGQAAEYGIVTYRPGEPKFIYLSTGGKMYLFKLVNDADNTADKILQSFKFLN